MMKPDEELLVFKSHIESAFEDRIPWDVLVSLMDQVCSTLEISKAVNHVLLEELKLFKIYKQAESKDYIAEVEVKLEENENDLGTFHDDMKHEDYGYNDSNSPEDDKSSDEDFSSDEKKVSKGFPCNLCDRIFNSKQAQWRHIKVNHENGTLR